MFLNTRWELRIEVKHLNDSFQELLYEQDNQQQKEKITNEIKKQLEERMRLINNGLNNYLIDNNTEYKQIKWSKYYADSKFTYSYIWEKNCPIYLFLFR